MTDLRTAAQQALDYWEQVAWGDAVMADKMDALRAALAQQAKPQGCDHCNHPLYAATRCRVCGRVTEQAEPVKPVAWVDERAISWLASRRNKASAHITTGLSAAKTIERTVPLYTAPPQRKPLSEEEISDLSREMVKGGKSVDWLCRAIERAHGITDPQIADRLVRHGIPMPDEP